MAEARPDLREGSSEAWAGLEVRPGAGAPGSPARDADSPGSPASCSASRARGPATLVPGSPGPTGRPGFEDQETGGPQPGTWSRSRGRPGFEPSSCLLEDRARRGGALLPVPVPRGRGLRGCRAARTCGRRSPRQPAASGPVCGCLHSRLFSRRCGQSRAPLLPAGESLTCGWKDSLRVGRPPRRGFRTCLGAPSRLLPLVKPERG